MPLNAIASRAKLSKVGCVEAIILKKGDEREAEREPDDAANEQLLRREAERVEEKLDLPEDIDRKTPRAITRRNQASLGVDRTTRAQNRAQSSAFESISDDACTITRNQASSSHHDSRRETTTKERPTSRVVSGAGSCASAITRYQASSSHHDSERDDGCIRHNARARSIREERARSRM